MNYILRWGSRAAMVVIEMGDFNLDQKSQIGPHGGLWAYERMMQLRQNYCRNSIGDWEIGRLEMTLVVWSWWRERDACDKCTAKDQGSALKLGAFQVNKSDDDCGQSKAVS
jgi:hypothetical protein